jgi:hypothetical protein
MISVGVGFGLDSMFIDSSGISIDIAYPGFLIFVLALQSSWIILPPPIFLSPANSSPQVTIPHPTFFN